MVCTYCGRITTPKIWYFNENFIKDKLVDKVSNDGFLLPCQTEIHCACLARQICKDGYMHGEIVKKMYNNGTFFCSKCKKTHKIVDLRLKNISDDSDEEFQEKPPKYVQRRHQNH